MIVSNTRLIEPLRPIVTSVMDATKDIPEDRVAVLSDALDSLRSYWGKHEDIKLTFICTHNSRRSHLSQVWAQVAACYFGVDQKTVSTFSGGTEATACNPRTVRAFRRAGFSVVQMDQSDNPRYFIQFAEESTPLKLFSKVYDQDGNPTEGYAAFMTCDHADQNCPIVRGAAARISLPFIDPKESDGTERESETYFSRLQEIGRDIFWIFSRLEQK